jgi:Tfp pilus assembly protein PilO
MAVLAALLVVGLGGLLLVWPSYRELAQINLQTEVLRDKGENHHLQVRNIANLRTELDRTRDQIASDLKVIPDSPDVADVMRILSKPLDGVYVHDQTFRSGNTREAVPGSDMPVRVQPLTVEIEGRFGAIFDLIVSVESMQRLVRISSLRVECDHKADDYDWRVAKASIVLEAVYNDASGEAP